MYDPISMKFGGKAHADGSEKVKSKPEVQFQYGGRLFSETGSSCISAIDWDLVGIWYANSSLPS